MKRIHVLFPFLFILLICLISARFLFFVSYIHIQKAEFRKQLIVKETRDIVQFEFSEDALFLNKNGVEWKEKNKELVVKGVYHEVVSITKKNGRVIVSAIEDKTENKLFQKYFALNKHIQHGASELIKHLLSFTYLHTPFSYEFKASFQEIKPETKKTLSISSKYVLKSIKPPEIQSVFI